jgi:penicillin amidase
MIRRITRFVAGTTAMLLVVALIGAATSYLLLRASLPRLDGEIASRGLEATVTIERDALGVPTIRAANRADLAFGAGFVHAQDRFFQMDLSRRLAAGDLAELFGEAAADQDRKARAFGFRKLARDVLERASAGERAVAEAYAAGVNAGLGGLRSRPWEYWLLRARPAAWRVEDSVLAAYAMWWDLQYGDFRAEIQRRELDERLGGPVCASGWKCATEFLYPAGTSWDAPNGATAAAAVPASTPRGIPPAEHLDVRSASAAVNRTATASAPTFALLDSGPMPGSNNWALAGALVAGGGALLASDMHLGLRVPAVWYRARLIVQPEASAPAMDLNGLTLPGAPMLIAGSNGHIAWSFTNAYGDWLDVEAGPCDRDGGVKIAERDDGTCWFGAWLAQHPEATNLRMLEMERADSVERALELAPLIGIPHQNLLVAGRDGRIAWQPIGRIPRGTGSERVRVASGWLEGAAYPRIVDPESGRLWTANARATNDAASLAAIGGDEAAVGAHYDLGARAGQIRDALAALDAMATPADMLQVQLDDRARFLARWRELLLGLLEAGALEAGAGRSEMRRIVEAWNGRASADSAGYRLVRAWRSRLERTVWDNITGAVAPATSAKVATPASRPPPQFEGPLWQIVTERPMHLLPMRYTSWSELLLGEVDATLDALREECETLAACTWGRRAPVRIRHPLSQAVPFLAPLLDMPTLELAGDHDMPRVQDGSFGASNRFAVSPGREAEGYVHIPGGQSGHPLSPFYRAGFREWAEGKALPFLPGAGRHRLTLSP